mmetsp:Transcript_2042/g.1619  ORF Transcript_2042/g.1619 Transcript_2042/m.1619 type:complete len:121 (+) Transcript_2042:87-449(+)
MLCQVPNLRGGHDHRRVSEALRYLDLFCFLALSRSGCLMLQRPLLLCQVLKLRGDHDRLERRSNLHLCHRSAIGHVHVDLSRGTPRDAGAAGNMRRRMPSTIASFAFTATTSPNISPLPP